MSSPDKSFLDFYEACCEQEVKLQDELAQAGFFHANDGYHSNYAPNGVLAAIKQAGSLLEVFNAKPLADKPIVPGDDFNEDLPTQTLVEIINASVLYQPPDPDRFNIQSERTDIIDNCGDAEVGFMRTAEALSRISSDGKVLAGSQIFLHKQAPTFIRKAGSFPSTIGLKPISINGIPYPPGSLYSLEFSTGDAASYEEKETPDAAANRVEVYSARQVKAIRFLRLSAFALNSTERRAARFKPPYTADREGEPEQYFELELRDFDKAARLALERLDQIFGNVGRGVLELAET